MNRLAGVEKENIPWVSPTLSGSWHLAKGICRRARTYRRAHRPTRASSGKRVRRPQLAQRLDDRISRNTFDKESDPTAAELRAIWNGLSGSLRCAVMNVRRDRGSVRWWLAAKSRA